MNLTCRFCKRDVTAENVCSIEIDMQTYETAVLTDEMTSHPYCRECAPLAMACFLSLINGDDWRPPSQYDLH